MADDFNPFAAFSFGGSGPAAAAAPPPLLPPPPPPSSSWPRQPAAGAAASAAAKGEDPLCLWSGVPFSTAVQDPPPGEDGDETDEGEEDGEYEDEEDGDEDEDEEDEEAESRASVRKLAEYELISSFRQSTAGRHPKATVDDFHRFLLTLRGEQGRYWALVACLLSVQCLDTVALRAVRALMQLCPGGAADVGGLSDDDLAGALSSLNYFKSKVKYLKGCTEAVLVDGAFLEPTSDDGGGGGDDQDNDGSGGGGGGDGDNDGGPRRLPKRRRRGRQAVRVPSDMKGLLALPGVGPKIANLMLSVAFAQDDAGIVVDTHVHRLSHQLRWVRKKPHRKAPNTSLLAQRARLPWSSSSSSSSTTTSSSSASSAPLWVAEAGGSSCVLTPEQSRRELEKWVPLQRRAAFSLDVIGFGQIIRQSSKVADGRASGSGSSSSSSSSSCGEQRRHRPTVATWAEDFLRHVGSMDCTAATTATSQEAEKRDDDNNDEDKNNNNDAGNDDDEVVAAAAARRYDNRMKQARAIVRKLGGFSRAKRKKRRSGQSAAEPAAKSAVDEQSSSSSSFFSSSSSSSSSSSPPPPPLPAPLTEDKQGEQSDGGGGDWACPACTFVNVGRPDAKACSMCGTERTGWRLGNDSESAGGSAGVKEEQKEDQKAEDLETMGETAAVEPSDCGGMSMADTAAAALKQKKPTSDALSSSSSSSTKFKNKNKKKKRAPLPPPPPPAPSVPPMHPPVDGWDSDSDFE